MNGCFYVGVLVDRIGKLKNDKPILFGSMHLRRQLADVHFHYNFLFPFCLTSFYFFIFVEHTSKENKKIKIGRNFPEQ